MTRALAVSESQPAQALPESDSIETTKKPCLDSVKCVICEQGEAITRTWWHHLIPFCEHIDGACSICHDLRDEPCLKRRDHPVVSLIDHDDRTVLRIILVRTDVNDEPRQLDLIGIARRIGLASAGSSPATPGAAGAKSTVATARAVSAGPLSHGDDPGPQNLNR